MDLGVTQLNKELGQHVGESVILQTTTTAPSQSSRTASAVGKKEQISRWKKEDVARWFEEIDLSA